MISGVTAPADFKVDEFHSLLKTDGVRVDSTDIVSFKMSTRVTVNAITGFVPLEKIAMCFFAPCPKVST